IKLRNGGAIMELSSTAATPWILCDNHLQKFMQHFSATTLAKPRLYPVIAENIPLHFDPNNEDHMRQIEIDHEWPAGTIASACWLKSPDRHTLNQMTAYAVLSFQD
ncbi:hypothetical protein M422DRAFT_82107, partial [Sphaerobolus stellatus SS14]